MTRRIGILTGGGDAPGLNAVIRAFVKGAVQTEGWEVVGIEDAYNGLLDHPRRLQKLDAKSVQGLLQRGGTILGTTNRGDPFKFRMPDGSYIDASVRLKEAVEAEGIEGIVAIGGEGTQGIAVRMMAEAGVPHIGVPKTIDNDLSATDYTFGFYSAVDIATEALDRLHTTAESHERVMFLEVMGRDAGHIALYAGIAGGANVILLPEIPYDPAKVAAKIKRRAAKGRLFSIIVVAEGALPMRDDGSAVPRSEQKKRLTDGGGAAAIAMANLEGRIDHEMRACVLGHLQRGGSPVAFDRILATRFGAHAVELVKNNRWGEMVCLRDGLIGSVALEKAVSEYRLVDTQGQLIETAKAVGIEFGR